MGAHRLWFATRLLGILGSLAIGVTTGFFCVREILRGCRTAFDRLGSGIGCHLCGTGNLAAIACPSDCVAVGLNPSDSEGVVVAIPNDVGSPSITRFTPASGPPGTKIKISGANLSGATKVTFNGKPTTINKDASTTIVVHVPSGATTGKIKITTPSGTAKSATSFTVT